MIRRLKRAAKRNRRRPPPRPGRVLTREQADGVFGAVLHRTYAHAFRRARRQRRLRWLFPVETPISRRLARGSGRPSAGPSW